MTRRHAPRRGSLAYRPRVRARKETPSFRSFPKMKGPAKPINFFGYKAGMVHVIAKSMHEKGRQSKMDVQFPATVLECPPVQVYGVRAYYTDPYGLHAWGDVTADKVSPHAMETMRNFKKKSDHTKNKTKNKKSNSNPTPRSFSDFDSHIAEFDSIRLLVHTNPEKTTFGKKKAEVAEIALAGTIEEQLAYAKEKMGKTISILDTFKEAQSIDVRAVTRGFGFGGVVARFGVKTFRPKAKYIRTVGSISPLRPGTVAFTVARPGQLGYHNRTEFNKKILKISSDFSKVNPKSGFEHYGVIQNDFVLIAGSVPGPVKRLVGMRESTRPVEDGTYKIGPIQYISTTGGALP